MTPDVVAARYSALVAFVHQLMNTSLSYRSSTSIGAKAVLRVSGNIAGKPYYFLC